MGLKLQKHQILDTRFQLILKYFMHFYLQVELE